jgi:hypothetical protein
VGIDGLYLDGIGYDREIMKRVRKVLATAYLKPNQTLVSLASWAPGPVEVRLRFDWPALGLDPNKAHLVAPAIEGFQPAALFKPDEAIPIFPRRGWLLLVDQQPHVDGKLWQTIQAFPRDRFPGDPVALRVGKTGPGARGEDHGVAGPPGTSRITRIRVFGSP